MQRFNLNQCTSLDWETLYQLGNSVSINVVKAVAQEVIAQIVKASVDGERTSIIKQG